ncbi:hypothetical protein ABW20_dc0105410 [Dactylellina cionopaga]|nr:hypothetical protein ABW20_dc0105410 [Dactylellina cionopaga]
MKFAVVCTLLSLVPSALSHCLVSDAYGNANPRIHGRGIGGEALTSKFVSSFSNPPIKKISCKKCFLRSENRCGKIKSGKKKGQRKCTKVSVYDANCSKCRTRNIDGCGATVASGKTDIQAATSAMVAAKQIPQVTAGGFLFVTMFQVNTDGAGPYTCRLDRTGGASNWERLANPVVSPGIQGASICGPQNWTIPLTMPSDLACTGSYGGMDNICMVRCQNDAPNGPFGGCIPVQLVKKTASTTLTLPKFDTNPPCKSHKYKKSLTYAQMYFLSGDPGLPAAAVKYLRAQLTEKVNIDDSESTDAKGDDIEPDDTLDPEIEFDDISDPDAEVDDTPATKLRFHRD